MKPINTSDIIRVTCLLSRSGNLEVITNVVRNFFRRFPECKPQRENCRNKNNRTKSLKNIIENLVLFLFTKSSKKKIDTCNCRNLKLETGPDSLISLFQRAGTASEIVRHSLFDLADVLKKVLQSNIMKPLFSRELIFSGTNRWFFLFQLGIQEKGHWQSCSSYRKVCSRFSRFSTFRVYLESQTPG